MPDRLARKSRLISDRPRTAGHLALATLFLVLGCSSLQNAVAEGDTRTLSFIHTHRDDSLTITFKRNGRYDEEALKKLDYFLRDWRTNQQTHMAPQLFDVLWEVTREAGGKEPIHIVSSYRSPQTNAMLRRRSHGVAQFSQHMLGHAIDFFVPGVPLEQLRFAALRLQRGGVGFYPTSGSPFVHVDVGGIRHWPRMTHDQLVRVFPDEKTVHIPSDGHPLKNYRLALAEVQRRGATLGASSLSAAHDAGIQVADAGNAPRGRDVFAKLLGIGRDEDEENEAAAPAPRPVATAAAAPARQEPAHQEVAASVPLPRARPNRAGEFELASAETSAPVAANEVVTARGYWPSNNPAHPQFAPEPAPKPAAGGKTAEAAPEATAREAINADGERLAWVTGPQAAPPRPPRDIEGVSAEPAPDTTASISAWTSNPGQNDRVPADLALAYAAAAHPEPAATPAPMGSLRAAASPGPALPAKNATVATKRPGINPPAAKLAHRGNDPWLRGIVMTPSVHHSLAVNMLGTPDYRALQPLMHKPRTTVAMAFSNDPQLGLTSLEFSGPAVAFLPTLHYATRTAGLN